MGATKRAWAGQLGALLVILSVAGCGEPSEQTILRNAAFARVGQGVLALGVRYETTDPSAPYYADDHSRHWRLVFSPRDEALQPAGSEVVLDDPGAGGGPLFGPLWWRSDRGEAAFLLYDLPAVADLNAARVTPLRLPAEIVPDLFEGKVPDERGLVYSLTPSPDGRWIGVFYRLVTADPDNALIFHDDDAVAFFEWASPPRFVGAVALTPWQGEDAVLRLDPPLPVTDLPPVPPGGGAPPVEERRALVWPSYFLWDDSEDAVYVVDRGDDKVPESRVAKITVGAEPSLRLLGPEESLPGAPVATRGGGALDDGTLLYVVEPFDDPNGGGLELGQVEGWPGFAGRGTTTVSALDYGY